MGYANRDFHDIISLLFAFLPELKKNQTKEKELKVKKVVAMALKIVGFCLFTAATILPTILYAYTLFSPEGKAALGFLFLVAGREFFFQYIAPNVGYLAGWVFVVVSALRRRCKWYYHVILLLIGVWNWYTIIRLAFIGQFFKGIFGR